MNWGALMGAVVTVVVVVVPIATLEWRSMRPITASHVMRKLKWSKPWSVRAGRLSNVWTPAPIAPGQRASVGYPQMLGRGQATYALDEATDTVRMHWEPRRGAAKDFVGSVPISAAPQVRRAVHRAVLMSIGFYVAFAGIGALLGAMSRHSGGTTEPIFVGLVSGIVVGYFVSTTLAVSWRVQGVRSALAADTPDRKNTSDPVS